MSNSLKIAVVEDHTDLRDLYVTFLCQKSHDAAGFSCADELDDHLLAEGSVDLLVLDLNLPGENGYSIARRMRDAHPDLHILMLTARSAVEDRVKGYASGADIYLVKPVTPAELAAAVGSVARRVYAAYAKQVFLRLDMNELILRSEQAESSIGKADALLLKGLAEAPNRSLPYWRMMELLDLKMDEKGKAALEVRVFRLKKKMLEAGGAEPSIKSRWKEGYQLCQVLEVVK